jgi:membrane-bound serine protease (ClpP class)
VFIIHNEAENGSSCAAAKAVISLTLRIYMERRSFLTMEWAQRPPIGPRTFQGKIKANHLDDVIGVGNALDGFLGDAGHDIQNTLRADFSRGTLIFVSRFLLVLILSALTFASGARAEEEDIRKGSVVVVPLTGEVTQAQFFFLRRILKSAEAAEASALIIDMDTYGGSLKASVDILGALMKSTIPTLTYVNTNAGSAGALIALATKRIYMAPVSAIGAAAPISGGGEDLQETINAKVVSYFSGYFRSAAEKNGYNPELAEAFINKEKEVKIGDKVINPKGTLLTLSAQEAVKEYDGKPLLASGIASNLDDLCEKAGLRAKDIVRIEPSGFEQLAQWITMLAPLFLLGGMIGAYLEFKSPGFGVAGILSAICFLLFFAGHYIAGLTGFEVMAVFILGMILVLVELVFFPGVTLLALLGTALMLGALLFAMVDFYPSQPLDLSLDTLMRPLLNLGIALVLFVFAVSALARFLPELPFFNRLILATQSPTGPSLEKTTPAFFEPRVKVGEVGVARTILRPAGKAEFGAALVDVMTDGEFLDPGVKVRVTMVEGDRVFVEAADGMRARRA